MRIDTLYINKQSRYWSVISSFFIPQLHRLGILIKDTYVGGFNKMEPPSHSKGNRGSSLSTFLRETYNDEWTGFLASEVTRFICSTFLWGFLKSRVYKNNQLKNCVKNNINELAAIDVSTLRRKAVMRNVAVRARECVSCDGEHNLSWRT